MKAVVVGGRARADYLVGLLKKEGDDIVAINNSLEYCEYLSTRHDIEVVCGDGTKLHVLEEALIDGFDICIALTDSDADNLAVCQLAKYFFNVKDQVCIVSDPRNVEVFRCLGVGGVVNSTYLLAQAIEEATVEVVRVKSRKRNAGYLEFVDEDDDDIDGISLKDDIASSIHHIGR